MKNTPFRLLAAFALLLMAGFVSVKAQAVATQSDARTVINNAAITLNTAVQAVNSGGVKEGYLAKAYNHQRYAIELYKKGEYTSAVYQARRGKFFASRAIRTNNYNVTREQVAPDNIQLTGTVPTAEEIETDLAKNFKGSVNSDFEVGNTAGLKLADNE